MVPRRERPVGLVGRFGARDEEHAVEAERPECVAGERYVTAMNRIERAAEHTHRRQG
jgi:hypothetical protein